MKPGTENETASNGHETGGKCKESSGSLTRIDQVNHRNGRASSRHLPWDLESARLLDYFLRQPQEKKTRHYITRTTKQGLDDATSAGKRWSRRAQETVDDVKTNIAGVVEAGQKAYRTARDA